MNANIFSWLVFDIPSISLDVIIHKLNTDPYKYPLVWQKKEKICPRIIKDDRKRSR